MCFILLNANLVKNLRKIADTMRKLCFFFKLSQVIEHNSIAETYICHMSVPKTNTLFPANHILSVLIIQSKTYQKSCFFLKMSKVAFQKNTHWKSSRYTLKYRKNAQNLIVKVPRE